MEQSTIVRVGRVRAECYSFRKRNVLRFDLNEPLLVKLGNGEGGGGVEGDSASEV